MNQSEFIAIRGQKLGKNNLYHVYLTIHITMVDRCVCCSLDSGHKLDNSDGKSTKTKITSLVKALARKSVIG